MADYGFILKVMSDSIGSNVGEFRPIELYKDLAFTIIREARLIQKMRGIELGGNMQDTVEIINESSEYAKDFVDNIIMREMEQEYDFDSLTPQQLHEYIITRAIKVAGYLIDSFYESSETIISTPVMSREERANKEHDEVRKALKALMEHGNKNTKKEPTPEGPRQRGRTGGIRNQTDVETVIDGIAWSPEVTELADASTG